MSFCAWLRRVRVTRQRRKHMRHTCSILRITKCTIYRWNIAAYMSTSGRRETGQQRSIRRVFGPKVSARTDGRGWKKWREKKPTVTAIKDEMQCNNMWSKDRITMNKISSVVPILTDFCPFFCCFFFLFFRCFSLWLGLSANSTSANASACCVNFECEWGAKSRNAAEILRHKIIY